ncbi:response regulator [Corallococcus exiguus]|uniref:response regulator n=1 Tax=Corallococcus exiguus TaxID=83462 RepID=UPI001A9011CA|nr:response regulator [Corallococcus exiguus]
MVVDDERPFFETYQDILVPEGYRVEWAPDRKTAQARIQESSWDVVILDQRLQGSSGGDSGIDLISKIVPTGAKVIVATAYADAKMIERAFKDGAYDYLEKVPTLPMMLRIKVRNASEAVRERRLASLTHAQREKELQDLWAACRSETNSNRKGRLLEELMVLLFRTVPGLMNTSVRQTRADEEIDITLRNEAQGPFWAGENSTYVLVECKNWSKHVGPNELISFRDKLAKRSGRCGLGFLVAPGGFTEGLQTRVPPRRKDDPLAVAIGPTELDSLVRSTNRNETFEKLRDDAFVGGDDFD